MGRTGRRVVAALTTTAALGVLAPTAEAATVAKPANIIRDAGAEQARSDMGYHQVAVPDWTVGKGTKFTAVSYDAPSFPTKAESGPKWRGKRFFAGGTDGERSSATQIDGLSPYAKLIRSGKADFTVSAWLGGYLDQDDFATVTVTWLSASGVALGHTTVGPVTAAARKDATGLLLRSKDGVVPKQAIRVLVALHMVRKSGAYIDGYADNLSLTIVRK